MPLTLFSVLIIDNKKESVALIKKCIKKHFPNNVLVIAVFAMLEGAIDKIRHIQPKIVIINSDLGEIALIKFLEIKEQISLHFQHIIISNHNGFALRALKHQAVGFVVKPLNELELATVLYKAIYKIKGKRLAVGVRELDSVKPNLKFITITTTATLLLESITFFISIDTVIYCMALGNKTIFHTIDGKEYVSDKNLGKYIWLLENKFFFRVHNRYLVNLSLATKIERVEGTSYVLFKKIAVPISSRKYPLLYKYLNLKKQRYN